METTHTIEFMQFSETKTPHIVFPDVATVFSETVDASLRDKFQVLLTIDLAHTHFHLPEKIHFVFHTASDVDQVSFMVQNGKYTNVIFEQAEDQKSFQSFPQPLEMDGVYKRKGWVCLLPQTVTCAAAFEKMTGMLRPYVIDIEGYDDQLETIVRQLQLLDGRGHEQKNFYAGKLSSVNYLGALPNFIQNGGYYPTDPEGNDMLFIGQCNAWDFGFPRLGLYLFYSPKHQLVTQLHQLT